MDYLSKKMICRPKRDILCRIKISDKNWLFLLQKLIFCHKTPKPKYIDLNIFVWEKFWRKKMVPWDPPGVPRVPISGPHRGIFSKLYGPGPLGSGGHSHTSFSNGRFRVAQRTLQYDVIWLMEMLVSLHVASCLWYLPRNKHNFWGHLSHMAAAADMVSQVMEQLRARWQ